MSIVINVKHAPQNRSLSKSEESKGKNGEEERGNKISKKPINAIDGTEM